MSARIVRYHANLELESELGFSQAVRVDDLLFISGTVAMSADRAVSEVDGAVDQYRTIYQTLGRVLEAHGLDFGDVVKETIFVQDLADFFARGNIVRMSFYPGDSFPAATAVEVSRIGFEGHRVEIELVASFA